MTIKLLASGDDRFVALWRRTCDRLEEDTQKWVEQLRVDGFKAAHPNDGWVERHKNEVVFVYPHFNDNAGIGDKVMLGWPGKGERCREIRLVSKRYSVGGLVYWKFEDIAPLKLSNITSFKQKILFWWRQVCCSHRLVRSKLSLRFRAQTVTCPDCKKRWRPGE